MLTNSILGGNVYKFRVCLQALPIMALNHKLTSQSTLAWLRTVIVYPPKTRQKVIIKLNRRKDIRRILLNKNKLKNLKPESVNLWNKKKVKKKFSLMKVCACNTRNCGPNVKNCGVLGTFPRFMSAMDRLESSCPMNLCPWSHTIVIWKNCFAAIYWSHITSYW